MSSAEPGPLARFTPPLEEGVISRWLPLHAPPGSWLLDPFGFSPRLVLEAAKAMAAGNRAGLSISKEHAITWVTSVPAQAMGLGDRIGSLEPGKAADVVIWSGDPFSVYTLADQVFVDGAVIYDRHDPKRQAASDFEAGLPTTRPQP